MYWRGGIALSRRLITEKVRKRIANCSRKAGELKALLACSPTEHRKCLYELLTEYASLGYSGCGECGGHQCAFCWRGVAVCLMQMDANYNQYITDVHVRGENVHVEALVLASNSLFDCVKEGSLDGDMFGHTKGKGPTVRSLQLSKNCAN